MSPPRRGPGALHGKRRSWPRSCSRQRRYRPVGHSASPSNGGAGGTCSARRRPRQAAEAATSSSRGR
eukprot:8242472-Lingulodinium_polyedra.AAC.1